MPTAKKPASNRYFKPVEVPIPILGKKVPIYLHSLIALGILVVGWALLHILGTPFFGGNEEGASHIGHVLDMAIFASVALVLAVATLYILFFSSIQKIVLPHADELRDMAAKWRAGETITDAEAMLSLSWAISSGFRVLAVLLMIAFLATPL